MEIRVRNTLKGRVKRMVIGTVNAVVVVKLLNGIEVVSSITEESAERLNQSEKNEVYTVIKASDVMAATD